MSSNTKNYLLLAVGTIVLLWLLLFVGPELFDQHSTIALLAALAIYIAAPFLVYAGVRRTRLLRKDEP